MAAPDAEPLWRELLKVGLPSLLSVVLGVGSALYVTSHQASLQRDQLILDRKIAAIKEFSAVSWRGPAERAIGVISLKSRVDSILEEPQHDPAQRERVLVDYMSLISSFTRWGSEQASQAVITSALVRVEAPRYPKVDLSFVKLDRFRHDTPQGQTVAMKKIRDTLDLLSKKDIEFNLTVQDYVSRAANSLLTF